MRTGQHPTHEHDVPDVFSTDPEKRTIELAFLRRLTSVATSAAAETLAAAMKPSPASFAEDLAYVRSPMFAKMARALEESVSQDADFGPFREP